MITVSKDLILGKKVLLRYDIDVALGKGTWNRLQVIEDFKIKAGLDTLKLCLENAQAVTLIGHIGRPEGKPVPELQVTPIVEWFKDNGFQTFISNGKLTILENLRFDPREESADIEYAKELAGLGDFYVNEAFSSYRPSVSTTVLPSLMSHAAGLRFAQEVEVLSTVRDNPKKPFVAIMGGAKVKDKLPVINMLSGKADAVLVGGKLAWEIKEQDLNLPKNVMVGSLTEDGLDISPQTVESWRGLINGAAMIVWNGPLGKFEEPKNNATEKIIQMMLNSNAEVTIGGGDSVSALSQYSLFDKAQQKAFVSVGGGAMLKFLSDGTLPTIEALN